MELGLSNTLLAGDPRLVDHIVGEVKSQGIFDQFRKECIADVDTKPAYQNLRTRVEGSVNSFLSKQSWKPDLNKNQLRETLRKHIHEAPYLDAGVERIVDQVVNPKVYSVFMPQIEDVVYKFLGIERPKTREKNGACGLKDLLPKDLDPVSPESDKNSLKDVSLESVDAINDLEMKRDEKSVGEQRLQEEEASSDKNKDFSSGNSHVSSDEKQLDDASKCFNKTGSALNLNTSGKSDDKTEEDEEDSPTFEPIDIMNLNESNISNDSHLSGISELTSHRSRSPDFCNELSRDNFDYSNQDSQLSKVSSDSRLSIVTDFGSSNHASTPLHDSLKEDGSKDRCDVKSTKDNFKAVRDFDACKNKNSKNIFDLNKVKDVQDVKDSKGIKNNLSSKENSRDATDSAMKDKYDHKNNKDKSRDSDSSKSKSRDKNHVKDPKYKDKNNDKKRQRSHSSMKYDKYDKSDKSKSKSKGDQAKENTEKVKDVENSKDGSNKPKEDKPKDPEKKDSNNKEAKDLKDLYKEKIRELREKKELTEKEKLNKDNKEVKPSKDSKDRKDSPKDKKSYKKDHKSSSSKNSSIGVHELKTSKSSEKIVDGKERRSESKDKSKRDERRSSKDMKSKNHVTPKSDSTEKSEKPDVKKIPKTEKDEKTEKAEKPELKKDVKSSNDKINGKKDTKNHSQSKGSSRNDKIDGKKDSKTDSQGKDKKRREEKKSKSKDDHSSLRKNSNDRRSTDRDGSNGSSSKSSQSSNFSSNATHSKSGSSSLSKETGHVSNSSGETSDSIEEAHTNELKLTSEQSNNKGNAELSHYLPSTTAGGNGNGEVNRKQVDSESSEMNLPLKKRPLLNEDNAAAAGEVKVKKPKFAKNIHEAKKLMKIRKQIEKQKLKETKKMEKIVQQKVEPTAQSSTSNDNDNLESVPDEERVQIIEIRDEEYEEPYPEKHTNLTLEEGSIIMLEGEPCTKDLLHTNPSLKLKLSEMELCIRQSLSETIPTKESEDTSTKLLNSNIEMIHSDSQNIQSTSFEAPSIGESSVAKTNETDTMIKISFEEKKSQQEACISEIIGDEIRQTGNFINNAKTNIHNENKPVEQILTTNNENTNEAVHAKSKDTMASSKFIDDFREDSRASDNKDMDDEGATEMPEDEYIAVESTSMVSEDNEVCRYFKADNEKSEKFSNFLESLELVENSSLEDIIESLGGQVVSSIPKAMAPPLPKRKHSSSPLTDILLNNSNNNNDGHKKALNSPNEDALNNIKKRKLVAPKKQRLHANLCTPQGLLNGENFVMPLSPESDVSATSEKIPSSNLIKEEKGRHRSSQRYSSDDLYKPRPLFSSSSRRSRRSNQA